MSFQILLYHGLYREREEIRGKPAREYVSERDFRGQVRWLRENGYSLLTLGECLSRSERGELPRRTVCLSFDDGKRSDLELAAPVLAEEGVRGTFFVIPGWLGNPNIMVPEEVRRLAGMGMEIGSHSMTHPFMSTLSPAEMDREAADSKRCLENLVGTSVENFSYPFGDVDRRSRDAVVRAGYRTACGTRRGANTPPWDWLLLRRWGMHETTGLEGLRRILDRGTPTLLERGADWVKRSVGTDRYVRWRERILRRAGE